MTQHGSTPRLLVQPGGWADPCIAAAAAFAVVVAMCATARANPGDSANLDLCGRVVGVSDGDTVTLLTAEKVQVKVRLAGIDAPERSQEYSRSAKKALSDRALGKHACVDGGNTDRYGRTLGKLVVDGRDLNAELVRLGLAWVYRAYTKDPELLKLEAEAKAQKRGLWQLPSPVPPWEYRRRRRRPHREQAHAAPSAAGGNEASWRCGSKTRCREMTSCAEARFHLKCGVSSLDGDGDGVPCEVLCEP